MAIRENCKTKKKEIATAIETNQPQNNWVLAWLIIPFPFNLAILLANKLVSEMIDKFSQWQSGRLTLPVAKDKIKYFIHYSIKRRKVWKSVVLVFLFPAMK